MCIKRKISLLLTFIMIINTCVFADSSSQTENGNGYGTDIVATPSAIDIVPSGISIDMSLSNSEDIDDMLISTNYTLEENENVDNLTLNGGTLDLNGCTLTVYGNLQQNGGTLYVHNGNLIITGNYSIGTENNSPSAYIKMTEPCDYVYVGGNFLTNAYNSHDGYLTDGIFELKGNFKQVSTAYYGNRSNFYATDNHIVVFSGDNEQEIYFGNPQNSKINILDGENSAGLNCLTYAGISCIQGTGTNFDTLSLSSDVTILDNINTGDLNINANTFYVNGNTINISGDVNISGGCLNVSGGQLYVSGNFSIGTESSSPSAYLTMINANDYIMVGGNFFTNAYNTHNGYLTNGTIEIKGNFKQASTAYYGNRSNFYATDNHKVIFSGNGVQTIYFNNPTTSKFKKIESSNPLVTCTTDIGASIICGSNTQFDTLKISSDCTVNSDFSANDFYIDAGIFDVNGKNVEISGNTQINNGTLYLNGGHFNNGGNFSLSSEDSSSHTFLKMQNSQDYLIVGGDFFTNAYDSHDGYLTNGTIEVKGNFKQISTAYYGNRANFYASDNHRIIFSGNDTQTIYFGNPANSKFSILETINPYVTCSTDIGVSFIDGSDTTF